MNAAQRRELSKVRRFIKAKDISDVSQGIALLDALGDPELWSVLAEGLSVNAAGKLVIPKGCEVYKRARAAHRPYVALWMLSAT